ncbi:isochorismate synthase [Neiella marina]|uniref:Isochorismate synthase MenF n=1 Tax=Neiella holothuriorum TaxID=2870530 RepID=A0ABS7EIR6_9GAMM|nr:isochorismate synthase [Neiella holothuriorum]MBW8192220.1 isochorismate synthase [Neiella holothuriorum]
MLTVAFDCPADPVIEQLQAQLDQLTCPTRDSLVQLSVPVATMPALAWLQAQTNFPKMYWSSRDGNLEASAVGSIDQWWLDQTEAKRAQWPRLYVGEVAAEWRYYGGHGFQPDDAHVSELGGNRLHLAQWEYRRDDEKSWLIFNLLLQPSRYQQQLVQARKALLQLKAAQPIPPQQLTIDQQQHSPNYDHWQQRVLQLTSPAQQQRTSKVVLCRETTLQVAQLANPWGLLDSWQAQQHGCYQFGMQVAADKAFFGCSPERLFLRKKYQLYTEALAGTCARGQNQQHDHILAGQLLNDRKNIYENQLVADDIELQLAGLSQQIDIEPEPHLVPLAQVSHLCRIISARLNPQVTELELLNALHPTAAVGGLPRQSALHYLAQHENVARSWYAGVFGMIGEDRSEFCVTIRSMEQDGQQLRLFTGAGIVAGSDPRTEWHELNSKLKSAMSAVQS